MLIYEKSIHIINNNDESDPDLRGKEIITITAIVRIIEPQKCILAKLNRNNRFFSTLYI